MHYLSEDVKITPATTTVAGAAAATDIEGAGLSMAGFDGVLVIVPVGTIVTGAVTSINMQQSDDDAATDAYSDIAGTAQTIADTADNTTFYIDLQRPTKLWVRVHVDRATQNATFGGITYIQYHTRNRPTTHAATVSGEKFTCPAEGTA